MPSSQSPIPFNDHHRQDADLSGEVDGGVHQAALRLTTLSCDGPYNDDTARDHELLNEGEDSKALFQAISRASDASRITVNRKSRRSYEQPKRVRNDILKLDTGGKQTAVGKPAVKQSRKRSQKGRVRFSAFTKDHDGLDEVSWAYDTLVWRFCTKMDIEDTRDICEHVEWNLHVLSGVRRLTEELYSRLNEARDLENRLRELCENEGGPSAPETENETAATSTAITFMEGWNPSEDCRCTRSDNDQCAYNESTQEQQSSLPSRSDSDSSNSTSDPQMDSANESECSDSADCPMPPKPPGLTIRAPSCTFAQLAESSAACGPRPCAETPTAPEESEEEQHRDDEDESVRSNKEERQRILRTCSTKPGMVPVLRTGGGTAAMLKSEHIPFVEKLLKLINEANGLLSVMTKPLQDCSSSVVESVCSRVTVSTTSNTISSATGGTPTVPKEPAESVVFA